MNYCRGCGAGTLDDKDWCPSCGPSRGGTMSLTQCRACDEWCESEYCSDECRQQADRRDTPL